MSIHGTGKLKVENKASPQSFGWLMALLFSVVAVWPLLSGGEIRAWAVGVAAAFVLVLQIKPKWLQPLNKAWFMLGVGLGMVMVPVVFGVLYFVVITPIGLLMRATGKDPLLTRKPAGKTYWITRTSGHGNMRQQF